LKGLAFVYIRNASELRGLNRTIYGSNSAIISG
jgi:hypothetical protein